MINNISVEHKQEAESEHLNKMSQDAVNLIDHIHPQYISSFVSQFAKADLNFSGSRNPAYARKSINNSRRSFVTAPDGKGDSTSGNMYVSWNYAIARAYELDTIICDKFSLQNSLGNVESGTIRFRLETGGSHDISNYTTTLKKIYLKMADDSSITVVLPGWVFNAESVVPVNFADFFSGDWDLLLFKIDVVPLSAIAGGSGIGRTFELVNFALRVL
jgi:hypothetical protein